MTDQLGIRIGRDPTCDLVVDDPFMSKFHAQVVNEDGRLVLEDLGSINGTFWNGLRVYRVPLDAGNDLVKLGHTEWPVREWIERIRGRHG